MGSAISFTGLASGIDTQAIVEKLMELERRPVVEIQEKQLLTERRLAFFQSLGTKLSAFNSSIAGLNDQTSLNAKSASSTDDSILSASATSYAQNGSYTISEITSLATAHSEAFVGIVDREAEFDAGTFFEFEVDGTTYNIDLTAMDDSDKTLVGLRDAINTEAGDDVNAFIMNTGDADDPYKLVIQSLKTGENNRVSNISTDIDVATSAGTADLDTVGAEQVLGTDATFVFNGVTINRESNSVSDLVEGLTLELKGETTNPVTITIASDSESVKSEIEDFIANYNEINTVVQEQFAFDAETQSAGFLSGDSTLRQIQSTLQQSVVRGVTDADGHRYSLGVIGVEFDKETGALSLDDDKFEEAMNSDDKELFLDLFATRGVATDSDVRYVSSSSSTQEGTFGLTVTGVDGSGNVEGYFTLDGTDYIGEGSGNYLKGPDGSPMEDLKVGITEGVTGDLGTIHFSIGVAGKLENDLNGYLSPLTGLLPALEDRLESDIKAFEDRILEFEERLADRERILTSQFLAAEEAISQLQSQQASFQAQLSNL